ncbi:hypothetical protein GGE61_006260 [Rhizobium leguminosarum]|nr:hypothetical protein [Rhizobium leguminosarum]
MKSMLKRIPLFPLLLAGLGLSSVPVGAEQFVGRASVIDGDTIEIAGQRIRLNGIDAPESWQACRDAAGRPYRCGKDAAFALDEFLSKSPDPLRGSRHGQISARCCRLLQGRWAEREFLAGQAGLGDRLAPILEGRVPWRSGNSPGGACRGLAGDVRPSVSSKGRAVEAAGGLLMSGVRHQSRQPTKAASRRWRNLYQVDSRRVLLVLCYRRDRDSSHM